VSNRTDPPSPAATQPLGFPAWLRARWSRLVAGLAFAVVAGVTGVVSYTHIEELTLALHQHLMVARLMPLGIDGLIVVGSVALLQAGDDQPRLGWLCVAPGAVASLFANVESGIRYGWLAAAWAGMASAGFFLATFTLERWLKSQAGRGGQDDTAGQSNTIPNADDTEDAGADPCAHKAPRTVEEAVIMSFLHAQECDGQPLSQRQLSAAFGVSRARVAELVAPYLPQAPAAAMNGSAAGP
jgi:Protein of unknown function (DUF2637)